MGITYRIAAVTTLNTVRSFYAWIYVSMFLNVRLHFHLLVGLSWVSSQDIHMGWVWVQKTGTWTTLNYHTADLVTFNNITFSHWVPEWRKGFRSVTCLVTVVRDSCVVIIAKTQRYFIRLSNNRPEEIFVKWVFVWLWAKVLSLFESARYRPTDMNVLSPFKIIEVDLLSTKIQ